MNINLNNYEEYFLLYADNELSDSQKKIVEMFVAANPQLSSEFNDILSTVFSADEISLPDKTFLLKTPMDLFINDANFEERFVAYHDGELTDEEESFVDQFLETQKEKSEDFHLIGQARLDPDLSITFSDKETLYKRSPKVFRMGFVRLLAVAAVTGAIIWIGINRLTDSPQNPQQVTITKEQTVAEPEQKEVTAIVNAEMEPPEAEVTEPGSTQPKNNFPKEETTAQVRFAGLQNKEEDKRKDPTQAMATADVTGDPATGISVALADPKPMNGQTTNTVMEDREVFALPEQSQTVRYVSFELEPEPDEYVFMDIPAETLRRSKVGVLFKKVKRTIDRNNPINRLFNADETD